MGRMAEHALEQTRENYMPNETPTAPHVYAAIASITGKLAKTGISKEQVNTFDKYKFRGIDDVYNAVAPHLAEAQLCMIPQVTSRSVVERESQKGGALFYVVVEVDYEIVSAVDGSRHTAHVVGEAMDRGDKATNKAMSAAFKYLCLQLFCIPTEGDNDADTQTHEVAPQRAGWNHSPADGIDLSGVDLEQMHQYADSIKTYLDGGDTARAHELWRELSRAEQVALWRIKQPHGLNLKHKESLRTADKPKEAA